MQFSGDTHYEIRILKIGSLVCSVGLLTYRVSVGCLCGTGTQGRLIQ